MFVEGIEKIWKVSLGSNQNVILSLFRMSLALDQNLLNFLSKPVDFCVCVLNAWLVPFLFFIKHHFYPKKRCFREHTELFTINT